MVTARGARLFWPAAAGFRRGRPRSDGRRPWARVRAGLLLVLSAASFAACGNETLDAGSNHQHGILPVDERNPLIVCNDGSYDNWQGEYAVLLAAAGGSPLAGIIVNSSPPWPDVNVNVAGWMDLVEAARASGLPAPDPTPSPSSPLKRPASGQIDETTPNGSDGARRIIELARELALPDRPVVIATGGSLTEVADAYLLDKEHLKERVVVVSSLGTASGSGGEMGPPNGEADPWAATIVARRLNYIQVSGYYDQTADVPEARIPNLPANAFGARMAKKQKNIYIWPKAADQVSVVAARMPQFVITAARVSAGPPVGANASAGPDLTNDPRGPSWLVSEVSGPALRNRIWQILVPGSAVQP